MDDEGRTLWVVLYEDFSGPQKREGGFRVWAKTTRDAEREFWRFDDPRDAAEWRRTRRILEVVEV